jgi:hypothetical protein
MHALVQLLERCKCSRCIEAGPVTRNLFPFRLETGGEHLAPDTGDILKAPDPFAERAEKLHL